MDSGMAEGKVMNDRRRSERYEPPETVLGKVKATVPARVMDISRHGLQVMVPAALRPSVECDLDLPTEYGGLSVRARICRCKAHGFVEGEDGERRLMYRAGLEFVNLDAAAGKILDATIHRLREQTAPKIGPPPIDGGGKKAGRRHGPIKIRINAEDIRKRLETENGE